VAATQQAESALATVTMTTEQAAAARWCVTAGIAARITSGGMAVSMSAKATEEMAVVAEAAVLDAEDAGAAAAARTAAVCIPAANRRSTIRWAGHRGSHGCSHGLAAIRFTGQPKRSRTTTGGLGEVEESQAWTSASMLQQAAAAASAVATKPTTARAAAGAGARVATRVAAARRSSNAAPGITTGSTGEQTVTAQAAMQAKSAMPLPALISLFTVPVPQAWTELRIAIERAAQPTQERPTCATAVAARGRAVVVQRIALAIAGVAIAIDLALGRGPQAHTSPDSEGGGDNPTAFVQNAHRIVPRFLLQMVRHRSPVANASRSYGDLTTTITRPLRHPRFRPLPPSPIARFCRSNR